MESACGGNICLGPIALQHRLGNINLDLDEPLVNSRNGRTKYLSQYCPMLKEISGEAKTSENQIKTPHANKTIHPSMHHRPTYEARAPTRN